MQEKVTATAIKIALAEKHWKDFFLTEVKSGPTQLAMPGGLKILDGLAVRKSWTNPCFTGYEVKISRSDFLRDAKFYTYEELCNCLYIVCPKGMIERTELPESVGLMYYDPEKKTITTRKKAIFRKIEYSPEMLIYIIFSASTVTATRFSPKSGSISRNTSPGSEKTGTFPIWSRRKWSRTTPGSRENLSSCADSSNSTRRIGRLWLSWKNTGFGDTREKALPESWTQLSPGSARRIFPVFGRAWSISLNG